MEMDAPLIAQFAGTLAPAVANVAAGVWLSASVAAWLLSLRTLATAFWGHGRRFVNALRWATWTMSVNLLGLIVMVSVVNPIRYRTGGWFLSLAPLTLTVVAVMVASRAENGATSEA
jgi:hypothetical protein